MLEYARHHDALVVAEDVLGAVAMVHVEVDDRHALDAVMLERVLGPDGDVVEEAKPHRAGARRVMAGRAHCAKRVVGAPSDHEVGRKHRGPRRVKRRVPGVRAHRGVGIEVRDPAPRRGFADRFDVFDRMHPGEFARLGHGSIVALEESGKPRGDEVVFDRGEPCRALRMVSAHVVSCAVGMRDKRRRHELYSFRPIITAFQ